jgi:hypothetical protein
MMTSCSKVKEPQKINPDKKSDTPNGLSLSPEFKVSVNRIKANELKIEN